MSRRAAIAVVLSIFLVEGCALPTRHRNKPIVSGPKFTLAAYEVAATTEPIDVRVIDERHDWEKRYYAGSDIPEKHEWAISFVPMENFQPTATDTIKAELANRLAELPDPPASVDLKLRSFRVVFDDTEKQRVRYEQERERKRQEREEQRREEERERLERERFGSCDEDDREGSIGSQIVGDILGAMLGAAFRLSADATSLTAQVEAEKRQGKHRVLTRPPDQIRGRYAAGLSCEIRGIAVLTWSDGRTAELNATGRSTSPDASSLRVASSVRQAIAHFGQQMTDQAALR